MVFDTSLVCIIKVFQALLRRLPESIQSLTGSTFGGIAYYLLAGRRKVALENIGKVFPQWSHAERKSCVKKTFQKLGINFIELMVIPFVKKEDYTKRFRLVDRENMDRAIAAGKGVIALAFHFGNWEIMGVASALLDHEIVVLARPLKKRDGLNRYLNELRGAAGLKVIPNVDTARDVVKFLKEKKIVGFLADQREKRSKAIFVDFFGSHVPTNKGIAAIGMRTGSPVVPIYFLRDGFLRYRVVLGKAIEMERGGNMNELLARNTRKINEYLENLILEDPDEWFWVHRRWARKS